MTSKYHLLKFSKILGILVECKLKCFKQEFLNFDLLTAFSCFAKAFCHLHILSGSKIVISTVQSLQVLCFLFCHICKNTNSGFMQHLKACTKSSSINIFVLTMLFWSFMFSILHFLKTLQWPKWLSWINTISHWTIVKAECS